MEQKKAIPISKLKQPTVTNLTRFKSTTNVSKEAEGNKASLVTRFMKMRQPLTRRSKSFSTVESLKKENTVNTFKGNQPRSVTSRKVTPPLKKPLQSSNKTTVKRPAPEKTPCETKPKVLKPSKPAPYDYKARFNLLQEKHTALSEKYKELQHCKTENDDLKNKLDILTKDFKEEKTKLSEELKKLKARIDFLEPKYVELESVKEVNTILNQEIQEKSKELLTIETKMRELSNKNFDLTNLTENLKSRNEDLESKVIMYKLELQNNESMRRNLHNMCQDLKGRIRVYCRVRPLLSSERDKTACIYNFNDETSLELKKSSETINCISGKANDFKQEFNFDRVFPPETAQCEVFQDLAQLVQSAIDGYNICVFAYGQTGSGKTFTMLGTEDNKGMIPRTVELLYTKINHLEKIGWVFEVESSFLEIYNETIRDLLNPTGNMNHDIKFNEGNTIITNLQVEKVKNENHLLQLIASSQRNRAVAVTDFNEHSSRSHSVTKISIKSHSPESNATFIGSVNLVDLAGSESAKTSSSERITETKNINKSLSCLGTVMLALRNKESHIPYRNSKLTYLLQSSLGGNSKTLMFVNVSPLEDNYSETINSLRFAAKVKQVKLGSKRTKMYK